MTTLRVLCALLLVAIGAAPVAAVGVPLPPWQAGMLDIHVIRVERGGDRYRAIVLEDMHESTNATAIFGPHQSR